MTGTPDFVDPPSTAPESQTPPHKWHDRHVQERLAEIQERIQWHPLDWRDRGLNSDEMNLAIYWREVVLFLLGLEDEHHEVGVALAALPGPEWISEESWREVTYPERVGVLRHLLEIQRIHTISARGAYDEVKSALAACPDGVDEEVWGVSDLPARVELLRGRRSPVIDSARLASIRALASIDDAALVMWDGGLFTAAKWQRRAIEFLLGLVDAGKAVERATIDDSTQSGARGDEEAGEAEALFLAAHSPSQLYRLIEDGRTEVSQQMGTNAELRAEIGRLRDLVDAVVTGPEDKKGPTSDSEI